MAKGKTVAVVGGGWAGCAAGVELARTGHHVTLYEAARTLGGRARRVEIDGKRLDNGQHILLGAYTATLRLLKQVGIDARQALLNLPLQMRYPVHSDGMDFVAPRWPAPLHLAAALLRSKGLTRADKLSLARFSTTARWMDWHLDVDCSVTELLQRYDQTDRLIALMWRPLCLAALNTAPERASAKVFLNVLRDSLGAKKRRASDMLLPRLDLSALLPDAAAAYIGRHGGAVQLGAPVVALQAAASGGWTVTASGQAPRQFDAVVLATPAAHSATLLQQAGLSDAAARIPPFEWEAITTCYLQYDTGVRLALPFFALRDDAAEGAWGQFVFDRGQLDDTQAGLLAVIISASGAAAALGHVALTALIAGQLAAVFGRAELAVPLWSQVITEKRATFACTPGLQRPANSTGRPGLVLAGDYTASDYPATIEAAVRSGIAAAASL